MIKFIISLLAVFTLMSPTALAVDVLGGACSQAPNSSVCQSRGNPSNNPVNHIIHVAADILAAITGAVAIIMIIFSGFKFVTGGGSPESVKSARATLVASVIGLAIVALSWTIISFAVDKLIP